MITAPQGGVPFVDEDRTPSNSALIFLQELRNAVSSGGGGGSSTIFPLRAPDGSASTPSYSWSNEAASGFYRVSINSFRFSINGVDAVAFLPNTLSASGFPISGDATTFFYPTFNSNPAHGYTVKAGRLQVGLEANSGTQWPTQSPTSWAFTYITTAMPAATLGVTSQIGSIPIAAATRTSDNRTAFGVASAGSGCYFLGVNDDTGSGGPIISSVNPIAWRLSGVGGTSQAMQVDVNNQGSLVDVSPVSPSNGKTIGILITAGAGSNSNTNASAGVTWGAGANAKFRKGFVVYNTALDTSIGTFGGGIFGDIPLGASIRWMDNGGLTQNELGANVNGCGPINALRAGSLGIWPGIGDGGTVTQLISINTGVTLNTICGQIMTFNFTFVTGFNNGQAFIVTNSQVAATDTIIVSASLPGAVILAYAYNISAGSFGVALIPFFGAAGQAIVNFQVIKSVNS